MSGFLIDTDLLIDVLKGVQTTIGRLASLDGEAVFFSLVTEAELWAGVGEDDEEAGARLSELLAAMHPIAVDRAVARLAGTFRRAHKSQGTSLADSLIAASAVTHGLTLMTRNTKHFPMPELKVEAVSQVREKDAEAGER